ncbi:hypothetical protein JD844_031245 [Phrynosoma platyrhinos]|uniref:TELO2-interacting protein 2 n=1 Tax=Phrynosoma platyrhinos TaxID=52577 RepID=A0ABQ7T171_PHRPL|nr:hypothetical protein JD844_031245 [Phrynosoma platyrhinos]
MGPRPLLASLSLPSLEDPQCLEGTPVDRVLSQFLHLLATGTPGSSSTKASLVQDLGAILEVASCQWLLRRDPTYASFGLLGKVADALCQYAAPSQQGGQPNSCADRGAATSLVFCSILDKVDKAKDTEGLGTPVASAALHQITGPVFVFAITHVAEQPWSNPRTRPKAQEVLEGLLRVSGCRSVPEFLRGAHDDQEGWFAEVMRYLKPELTKETWQRNPATKFAFASMLQQVTRPWLSQHLENVLPPSLLLSDDYRVENKILGVQCLHHIIRNVPAADLCQFNRVQVVNHALSIHLYNKEPQVMQIVLLCILDLLPILEKASRQQSNDAPFVTPYDEVLQLVLTHMEAEHQLSLRRVYARNLPTFVERMTYHLSVLLKALLRMMWDVATDRSSTPEPVKKELLQRATECLLLLDHSTCGQVKVS